MSTGRGLAAHLQMGSCIMLAGALFLAASAACAQDQTAATPDDAIIARKTLMEALSDKMDDIEGAISAGKINLDQVHAAADTISIFLMAFPHLFPPATNQWKPTGDRDPSTDTFASPDVWARFGDFYQQAAAAAKSAFAASPFAKRGRSENGDCAVADAMQRVPRGLSEDELTGPHCPLSLNGALSGRGGRRESTERL